MSLLMVPYERYDAGILRADVITFNQGRIAQIHVLYDNRPFVLICISIGAAWLFCCWFALWPLVGLDWMRAD